MPINWDGVEVSQEDEQRLRQFEAQAFELASTIMLIARQTNMDPSIVMMTCAILMARIILELEKVDVEVERRGLGLVSTEERLQQFPEVIQYYMRMIRAADEPEATGDRKHNLN